MDISGKHCVVTGASRGIGAAIARALAAKGARLTLVARSEASLADIVAATGGTALPADLADPDQVAGLIDRAAALNGPVDVLVNNAGVDFTKPFVESTAEEIRMIHAVNLVAPIELCRQALPSMTGRGGHIVNVSSMALARGFRGMSTYCSTKAGLAHFGRVLALELEGTGVGLTTVAVGPVPTDMLSGITYPPVVKSFARFRRMQLMPDVPAEKLASAIVVAIEKNKANVWRPRRSGVFPLLSGLPQMMVRPLLRGIDG